MPQKNFISLADFYTFIKGDSTGGNIPAVNLYFSVKYSVHNGSHSFFWDKDISASLDRLQYLTQKVDLQGISHSLKGFKLSGETTNGTHTASNVFGGFQYLNNSTVFPQSQSFAIQFLNTYDPIIESFFEKWIKACAKNEIDTGDDEEYTPRLDIDIKYWTPDNVPTKRQFGRKPCVHL